MMVPQRPGEIGEECILVMLGLRYHKWRRGTPQIGQTMNQRTCKLAPLRVRPAKNQPRQQRFRCCRSSVAIGRVEDKPTSSLFRFDFRVFPRPEIEPSTRRGFINDRLTFFGLGSFRCTHQKVG